MMLKYLIQTSIFRYSKNYGSLTHETRIKDAANMGDLICLLTTVRTLNFTISTISSLTLAPVQSLTRSEIDGSDPTTAMKTISYFFLKHFSDLLNVYTYNPPLHIVVLNIMFK